MFLHEREYPSPSSTHVAGQGRSHEVEGVPFAAAQPLHCLHPRARHLAHTLAKLRDITWVNTFLKSGLLPHRYLRPAERLSGDRCALPELISLELIPESWASLGTGAAVEPG